MDDLVPILSRDMGPPSVSSGGGGAPHVRRLKTLKRNREEKENTRKQVKLESVLGVTVSSNASLATAPVTGMTSEVLMIALVLNVFCRHNSVYCWLYGGTLQLRQHQPAAAHNQHEQKAYHLRGLV